MVRLGHVSIDGTKNRRGTKTIKCYVPERMRLEMREKMGREEAKKKYGLRKKLEKVFGHIKHNMGLRQFFIQFFVLWIFQRAFVEMLVVTA